VITSRRPLANTFAIGLVAVLGLSACQSEPSPERVARDLVRTLALDHPEVEECMLALIDDDYDLNDLGEKANSENPEISGPARAELDRFEADLVACDPQGVTRRSAP
jgi:uncharacterized lipoprotein